MKMILNLLFTSSNCRIIFLGIGFPLLEFSAAFAISLLKFVNASRTLSTFSSFSSNLA